MRHSRLAARSCYRRDLAYTQFIRPSCSRLGHYNSAVVNSALKSVDFTFGIYFFIHYHTCFHKFSNPEKSLM